MTAPIQAPIQHCLRLLLPFFLNRNALCEAEGALICRTHEAQKIRPCWEKPDEVPTLYQDEALPNVHDFLFGSSPGCCAYLRVPDETANYWFKNGGMFSKQSGQGNPGVLERPTEFEVGLAAPGIELFLSPHGAGVFSVSFEPKRIAGPRFLQDLNYRLSQVRSFVAYRFRLPHSPRNPDPPPAPDAPFGERLGKGGGAFTLVEWVEFLLEPLRAFGYRRIQEQFSVYSVTRFGPAADFTNPNVAASLVPYLAAVAHVEEYHHVGSLAVAGHILNPCHWAAVGSLGAAHLVADQDPPHPYDNQRLPTVLYKYFIPYLLSLMQRIALQRIMREARTTITELTCGCEERPERVAELIGGLRVLNSQSLAFTVNGYFAEVSSREAINQYYELAQQGLRVQDRFQTVQRALNDAEVMDNNRFQSGALTELGHLAGKLNQTIDNLKSLLSEAGENVRIVANVQSKVEWLEVFFVSYYATAMVYYVGHDHFEDAFVIGSLLAASFLSGIIAFYFLNPHKLQAHSSSRQPGHRSEKGPIGFLIAMMFLFAAWVALGFFCHQKKQEIPNHYTTVSEPANKDYDRASNAAPSISRK
ncbi:hypothetical protein B0F87_11343 [Methylobacter tundripaludum]|uniref:Uncharacterized protein n=2 Tax=Methylobacter tundripaludum TaxID=173365 RepID=A0A2S6H8V9_9GAMM|nr:hypothetical protein B0F87_11343 [Methylobacter tundripaludum]